MIAVVDDEESVRKAVVRVLQAAGFTARAFGSGTELLESWHFDRPDCLVLDLQMPGLSGVEAHQSLKRAGASFPVVIITAHDSPSLREECMNAGATAFLSKPLDIRTLVKAVSQVVPSAPPPRSGLFAAPTAALKLARNTTRLHNGLSRTPRLL
jgi:FixJ family two-component response regulator